MTDFEDPPRWADAPSDAEARVGSLLRAAREDTASDRELELLAYKLGPVLAPGAGAPLAVQGSLLAKLGASAALVVLAAGAAYYAHSRAAKEMSAPSAPRSPIAASPAPPSGASAPVAMPSSGTASIDVEAVPSAQPSPVPPAVHSGNRVLPSGASEGSAALDEAALLERARAALAGSPSRALALASEHAKRFPHGVLAQEREVIAIAALRRLGRTAEAERRAESFDRSYPHSAHQHTVDAEPAK